MSLLEHIAREIEKTGHTVTRTESSLRVEPINIRIESEIGERVEHDNEGGRHSVVISISIKATNEQLFPEGIWDCLAGVGENDDEAFVFAAEVWTQGVFAPIHEVLVATETPALEVPRLSFVTRNDESGEHFPWKLYLGALQASGEFIERASSIDENVLVQRMFTAITGELYEPRFVWIKAYIAKSVDGSLHGDCWLNNQDWMEGLSALYWFAEEWTEIKSFASLKQFMIVKACDWDEIENSEELKQALPRRDRR
jgi:hypothetical protein